MTARILTLVSCIALSIPLSAPFGFCREITEVDMVIYNLSQADIVPAYGNEKGIFASEGLHINTVKSANPAHQGATGAAKEIAEGHGRFGRAEAYIVASEASAGGPVRAIANLLNSNPLSLVYLAEKGWNSIKNLKGKKLGMMEGSTALKLLPAFLHANGLKMEDVTVVITPPAEQPKSLISGKVDAIGSLVTTVPRLSAMTDKALGVFTFGDHGLPLPGDVLFINTKYLVKKEDRQMNCRIFRAYTKAWEAAGKDPEGAVEAAAKVDPTLNGSTKEATKKAWLDTYARSQTRAILKKPMGYIFPEDWARTVEVLGQFGLLSREKPPTDYYTNEYVGCDPNA